MGRIKDIAIGLDDGDPESITAADKMRGSPNSLFMLIIFDVNHKLYYGFKTTASSVEEAKKNAFYRYRNYCRDNRYKAISSAVFNDVVKLYDGKSYRDMKRRKGTMMREI